LLSEVESLKALIATAASEREEALIVLNERQREIDAQQTTQVQLLGEIKHLNALIATTTGKHDEAVAALAAESAALASSRAALASTEKKLEKLDGALSRAKRELADLNAAVGARELEITTLRSSLAAAVDVGKAAFVALQTEPVIVSKAPSDVGWLASVLRPLGSRGRTRLELPKSFAMRGHVS
jgi:chromosome segregation ATPase